MIQNTKYKIQNTKEEAFALVEALLAGAVFVLVVTAVVGTIIYGRESSSLAGGRARAVLLAEEGLEAARNIRDDNFSTLAAGNYGVVVSSNRWRFSGSSDTTGTFTRQVSISEIDDERRVVTSTVTWQQNEQRTGSVVLTTYLHNWHGIAVIPSCQVYCQDYGYSDGTCRAFEALCGVNGEVYESGGDTYCTGGAQFDTCCCAP